MHDEEWLADQFESHRAHLRAVAYQMLGSRTDADDAVQETWLRLARTDTDGVRNLGGWLTTVAARVCLDMLRSRRSRREEPIESRLPDPIVSREDRDDPEHAALQADSVGLALLVVLDTLTPAERLAFVLHDLFGVPFTEIAPIVGRSSGATTQLASRARRRVRGAAPAPDVDLVAQRKVVEAFLAAARNGDLDGLVEVLDPDVVLRIDSDAAGGLRQVRSARTVAEGALTFSRVATNAEPVIVNGVAGILTTTPDGTPVSVTGCTVRGGRIVALDILADPERLRALLDLS